MFIENSTKKPTQRTNLPKNVKSSACYIKKPETPSQAMFKEQPQGQLQIIPAKKQPRENKKQQARVAEMDVGTTAYNERKKGCNKQA